MAEVVECMLDPSVYLVEHRAGYTYATRIRQLLDPSGQVDPITINIASVVNDLTKVDSHSELQATICAQPFVLGGHLSLELDGRFNCRSDA
jgi:hypothetical protein